MARSNLHRNDDSADLPVNANQPADTSPPFILDTLASSLGLAVISESGVIVSANPSFYNLLQLAANDVGSLLPDRLGGDMFSATVDLQKALALAEAAVVELRAPLGNRVVSLHLAELADGQRLVVAESLPAKKPDTEREDSCTDPLTGLGNRRLLSESLARWQPTAESESLAVVMMDLDSFKQVNDTLGHDLGDKLLKLVARRVTRAARGDGTIIRLGGDEFVVLHELGSQTSFVEGIAQRLVDLMGRPFLIDGQQINIGASVGIAVLGHGTDEVDKLLRHADLALYDAKGAGRGTYRFFNKTLETQALDRRHLEISLRRALSLDEFKLEYQPQVQLPERNVTGFEALIRWHNVERGLVSPVDFIPLAEETGEIIAIGEWVLRTACSEAQKWPGDIGVAVNVSPVQFECDRFVDSVRDALSHSGLAPERLEIEITEGVLINNSERVLNHLRAIKDMGVSIAMDDFGTGYCSLSYLNSFPFSKIKIDQAFVRGEKTEKSRALVDAIILLGTSLGMKTLAEGVETADQFDELAQGGCTAAQGYLISKPLPADGVTPFLQQHSERSTGQEGKHEH